MKLIDLLEKRASLWDEAKVFLDKNVQSDGTLNEADIATFEDYEKRIDRLDKTVEAMRRAESRDADYNQPVNTPIYSKIDDGGFNLQSNYKKQMIQAMRTGFSDRAVTNQLMTTNSGGYLLDTEMNDEIITQLEKRNVLREISHVIQTQSEHKVPILTDAPQSVWVEEGGQINFATDTAYSSITLSAYKLACSCKVTNELLFDSAYDLWEHVENIFSESISRAEQEAFINGAASDTTRPTGLISTISADTDMQVTASSSAMNADDVVNLVYELPREYRQNAVFLMSDSTAALLRKFKTADLDYIWQQTFKEGEPETLCGYRVFTSPYMPAASSGNTPIVFGDFNYFYIADRGTRTLRELKELFAANDLTGFLMTERVDCAIVQKNAFRALKLR